MGARDPEIGAQFMESLRHDADYFVAVPSVVFQRNRFAQCVGRSLVQLMPKLMADHDDARRAANLFLGQKGPTEDGLQSEDSEVVGRDHASV